MAKKLVKNVFNGKEYIINPHLTIAEKGSLVNEIAESVFDDGTYAPYIFEMIYKIACVNYYTDIEFPVTTDSDGNELIDFESTRKLIDESKVMDIIEDFIEPDIYYSAQSLLEFRKAEYLKRSKSDELIDAIISIINKFDSGIFDKFKDLDVKEVMELAKKTANKSEKKIVNEVLKFQDSKAKAQNKSE